MELLSDTLGYYLRQNANRPAPASTIVRIIELSEKIQMERFRLRRVRGVARPRPGGGCT